MGCNGSALNIQWDVKTKDLHTLKVRSRPQQNCIWPWNNTKRAPFSQHFRVSSKFEVTWGHPFGVRLLAIPGDHGATHCYEGAWPCSRRPRRWWWVLHHMCYKTCKPELGHDSLLAVVLIMTKSIQNLYRPMQLAAMKTGIWSVQNISNHGFAIPSPTKPSQAACLPQEIAKIALDSSLNGNGCSFQKRLVFAGEVTIFPGKATASTQGRIIQNRKIWNHSLHFTLGFYQWKFHEKSHHLSTSPWNFTQLPCRDTGTVSVPPGDFRLGSRGPTRPRSWVRTPLRSTTMDDPNISCWLLNPNPMYTMVITPINRKFTKL